MFELFRTLRGFIKKHTPYAQVPLFVLDDSVSIHSGYQRNRELAPFSINPWCEIYSSSNSKHTSQGNIERPTHPAPHSSQTKALSGSNGGFSGSNGGIFIIMPSSDGPAVLVIGGCGLGNVIGSGRYPIFCCETLCSCSVWDVFQGRG